MKGQIIAINTRNGFHIVRTEDNDFTVFEMQDSHEAALGDWVSGALDTLGSELLRNETQEEDFDVIVQAAHCSKSRAWDLLNR